MDLVPFQIDFLIGLLEGELKTFAEWVTQEEHFDVFFYFCERLRHLLEEMYEEVVVGEPMEKDPNEDEEDPRENKEEEGQVVEVHVENNPPEFGYISFDDEKDLAEVQNDFE